MQHPKKLDHPDWPDAVHNYKEFPLAVKKYLMSYGIGEDLCRKRSVLSCRDNSVIYVNCDKDGTLLSYQRRWVETRRFETRGEKMPTLLNEAETSYVVIVEDYASAIRISEDHDVVCLWGTKMPDSWVKLVSNIYDRVFVWLDNDADKDTNSGQIAAATLIKQFNKVFSKLQYYRGFTLMNKQCYNICSNKDPKYYTRSEIDNYIAGAIK